jgi:hypothetical protein
MNVHIHSFSEAPPQPNKVAISEHLYALAAPGFVQAYPDAQIEIIYGPPGVFTDSRWFSAFDLKAIIDFVEARSACGDNVYVGAALRRGPVPESGGANAEQNYLAAQYAWCEYEGAGDRERIIGICKERGLEPAIIVTTGTTPYPRDHLYFRIQGGIASTAKQKAVNQALRDLLGTDDVHDPIRVLRLGGCVNHPTEEKVKRGYVAELVTVKAAQQPREYSIDELIGAAPEGARRGRGYSETEEKPAPTVESFFKNVNALALVQPSHWVKPLFGNLIKFYPSTGCWRTTPEANKHLPGRARLEEAISISQRGVWDYGLEKPSDPISLVVDYKQTEGLGFKTEPRDAAHWLCSRMHIAPKALGWGSMERRSADDPEYANGYSEGGTKPSDKHASGTAGEKPIVWEDPEPLPILRPVAPFDYAYLPAAIAPWIKDIAERMQCPPDYLAVTALSFMGSLLGRKIAIRPQEFGDWAEVPNVWGMIIGRPGWLKSPAVSEVGAPIRKLEAEARKKYDADMARYEAEKRLYDMKVKSAEKAAQKAIDAGENVGIDFMPQPPREPTRRRYAVNDTTYEKLGVILSENPNGVMVLRDELMSLLQYLDSEERANALGLYLEGWNGKSGYEFDRILRGTTYIPAVCLSVFGTVQPGRIGEYIARVMRGGLRDSGMVQRFGLMVYPDLD